MPNWTTNTLMVSGSPKVLREMAESVKNGDNPFSLEKITGPEPDWASTPNEDGELPTLVVDPPMSECLTWANGEQDMRWREWRDDNWGTKWDTCDTEVVHESKNDWQVEFLTAWCDPEPAIRTLAKKFPSLKFRLYAEHECGSAPSDYTYCYAYADIVS